MELDDLVLILGVAPDKRCTFVDLAIYLRRYSLLVAVEVRSVLRSVLPIDSLLLKLVLGLLALVAHKAYLLDPLKGLLLNLRELLVKLPLDLLFLELELLNGQLLLLKAVFKLVL